MIFTNGFVHCDPHPGNLLINPLPNKNDFEIVLLDHGIIIILPN
jgi:aarF domain-containing kinase